LNCFDYVVFFGYLCIVKDHVKGDNSWNHGWFKYLGSGKN
jgi:hypothetical protein